jgi:hypothetical protein
VCACLCVCVCVFFYAVLYVFKVFEGRSFVAYFSFGFRLTQI